MNNNEESTCCGRCVQNATQCLPLFCVETCFMYLLFRRVDKVGRRRTAIESIDSELLLVVGLNDFPWNRIWFCLT